MKVNWTVRVKNKTFWLAVIPAFAIFAEQVLGLFGIKMELSGTVEQLLNIVKSLFGVLAIVGIVADPTTTGLGDSSQALEYTEPKGE